MDEVAIADAVTGVIIGAPVISAALISFGAQRQWRKSVDARLERIEHYLFNHLVAGKDK